MPRILHIIPTLDRSGAEKQLMLLATRLPRGEFDPHVCALTRSGPYEHDLQAAGVPLTIIGKSSKVDPAAFWRLKRQVASLRPDLVHTWLFAANSYGRAAALATGVRRIVASERCVDPWKVWHELAIDRWLARRTDRIVVNSSGIREFYRRHGIAGEKFVVIPNGIEAPPPSDVTRCELLAELGLPAQARLVGTVGRLWPQKRIKDLIWAADLLKVIRDDVYLLILGDGPHRPRLEQYQRQVRIEDKVRFLGHRSDVLRLMPHFDVLWLGSEYEGLPNAIMEAMIAGVPVVATDIPGNRDLVVPGETGYLVPIGDRAAFARHTQRVLEDAELAGRLGAAGRQRMLSEFSVEKMVERHAALYRDLLG
ncbi:MAG: glycosyl transferase family 1 [Planctomycetia bacterium 21-64-5]|nr:MAG: glycosyl transferase family 1 [Planctomycetia bacterium 21-64-5]HQU42938.1 glycosyltransferase [Pirellulales bacterium]